MLTAALVGTSVGPASAEVTAGHGHGSMGSETLSTTAVLDGQSHVGQERAVPILAIIGAAIAVGGSYYAMGERAGQRAYYAGLRNAEYQRVKWQVRGYLVAVFGPVGMPIFMTGFENKFYSMS